MTIAMSLNTPPSRRDATVKCPTFVPKPVFDRLSRNWGSFLDSFWEKDWVREWNGWIEVSNALEICAGSEELVQELCADAEHRFLALAQDNHCLTVVSDEDRKRQLRHAGFTFGVGEVHQNNDCLTDSLLQLLVQHQILDGSNIRTRSLRKKACRQCRQHLIRHSDAKLRPCVLLSNGAKASVSQRTHDNAYLQHEIHGPAILRFFLSHHSRTKYGCSLSQLSIKAYTRYTSELVPPATAALLLEPNSTTSAEAEGITLYLYCHTGNDLTGNHYDPMWKPQDVSAVPPEHVLSPKPRQLHDTNPRSTTEMQLARDKLPPKLLATLRSHINHVHSQLWETEKVRTWSGWAEANDALNAIWPNEELVSIVSRDILFNFLRFVDQLVPDNFISDWERQQQLYDRGFSFGDGMGHDCDATLIDSILQLLLVHGIVKSVGVGSIQWRRNICHNCLAHLQERTSELMLSHTSVQHESRSAAILAFLVETYASEPSKMRHIPMELHVFCRYDADDTTPTSILHVLLGEAIPLRTNATKYTFHLYCSNIEDAINHRYDPIYNPKALGTEKYDRKRGASQTPPLQKKHKSRHIATALSREHLSDDTSPPQWFAACKLDVDLVFGGLDRATQIASSSGIDLGRGAETPSTVDGFLSRLRKLPWYENRTDHLRMQALSKQKFHFLRCNWSAGHDTLTDSLLQLLARHGIVAREHSERPADRYRICTAAREALNDLLTSEETERFRRLLASHSEHEPDTSRMPFHHRLHGSALLTFLLSHKPLDAKLGTINTIQLHIHSRFDGSDVSCVVQSLAVSDTVHPESTTLEMHLFNSTGSALLSCTYDPMWRTHPVISKTRKTAEDTVTPLKKQTFIAPASLATPNESARVIDSNRVLRKMIAESSALLREHPTLPADADDPQRCRLAALDDSAAIIIPAWHCSFRGCKWCGQCESELCAHLQDCHHDSLADLVALLPRHLTKSDQYLSVYNECIAAKAPSLNSMSTACFRIRSVEHAVRP